MTNETLIEIEKRRRGIKSTPKENITRIGKGFGKFVGGAVKGFTGLAKEGGRLVKEEIKAEIGTQQAINRERRNERRKASIRNARIKPKKLRIFEEDIY